MEKNLLNYLPQVRGRYQPQAPLGPQVWFRSGGPAEILFKPEDIADLEHFLKHIPPSIPVTVIGVGSNLLVRDKGVRGVVIKLGKGFNDIRVEGTTLTAGAAALDRTVALESAERGLSGFEYFVGIPAPIGGAVRMNAGAYGQEVKDHLISCEVINRSGERSTKMPLQLGFTYRSSTLSADDIVISATFQGTPGTPSTIHARLSKIMAEREDHLMKWDMFLRSLGKLHFLYPRFTLPLAFLAPIPSCFLETRKKRKSFCRASQKVK